MFLNNLPNAWTYYDPKNIFISAELHECIVVIKESIYEIGLCILFNIAASIIFCKT